MSKLPVQIDYVVAATVIKGIKVWLEKLEGILDEAALENKENLDKKGHFVESRSIK